MVLPGQDADLARVRLMCDAIRHRGPDDDGYFRDGPCALGMRRLSVLDLRTGHQPISNEDGTVTVVFNGEIYNFEELRAQLIAQGHTFRTRSDTEVLVHLYEQEGTDGIAKLRGMFAFALWDERRQRLLLVRDRFGKKPLYYAALPSGMYFGSELKCLRVAGVPLDIDTDALRLYFQFSYIPDPRSPFQQVRKVPPGCWISYTAGGPIEHGRYWRLPVPAERPEPGMTETETRAQLRDLFDESVRLRMTADVPLGAFLSGGIDSSSVVASMALQSSAPVKTFSIGFEEAAFNELPHAEMLARQYNTEHHSLIVQPDSAALLPRLARHFDEPFGDASAIPTFLVSEFAAQHVKVVLSGDGGDEWFAGYESFFAIDRLRRFDALPQSIRRAIAWTAERLPYSAHGKNFLRMASRPTPLERYFELNYTPYFLRKRLLRPGWMTQDGAPFLRAAFPDCLPESGADILTEALYFEATAKLTGDMLVKVDRMSMANSLEVRSPLLDHKLAEFAARIPHAWKMRDGKGKQILIEALGDRLPPALLTLPKKGFGVPLGPWFRGPLRSLLWDHLTGARFLNRDIVNPPFLRKLLEEHDRGRRDNQHWLFGLLMLALWFDEFAA